MSLLPIVALLSFGIFVLSKICDAFLPIRPETLLHTVAIGTEVGEGFWKHTAQHCSTLLLLSPIGTTFKFTSIKIRPLTSGCCVYHWGIPSSDGIPYGLADFFFFCVCVLFFFLLPPPKMAFLEAKHMEGNHGLT